MLPRNFYCTSSSDPQKYFVHNTSTIRRPSVAIPLCSSAYTTRFTKSGKVQKLFHLRGLALLARTWHVRPPETEAAGLRFDVCHVRINTFMMLRPVFTATTVVALYFMQCSKKASLGKMALFCSLGSWRSILYDSRERVMALQPEVNFNE